jgi:hypothetical protein
MVRASINQLTTGAASGTAALELIVGTLIKGVWVRRIEVSLNASTASVYRVGRPQAKGITPTTPVRLLAEQYTDPTPAEIVDVTTALAWATPPGVPAQFYRGAALQGAVGASVAWDFANLFVPNNTSLVLWNAQLNGTAWVNIVVDVQQ